MQSLMVLLDPHHQPSMSQATLPLSMMQADPLYRTCSPNCSALVYGSNSSYLGVVPSTVVVDDQGVHTRHHQPPLQPA